MKGMGIHMKTAVLLVSFGTTYLEARESSLEQIYKECVEYAKGIFVYQAYTSRMVINKLATQQIYKSSIEEAFIELVKKQVEHLVVIPTHMIPGREYDKIQESIERYQDSFSKISLASPVLTNEEDCRQLVPIIAQIVEYSKDYEYILMGHGTDVSANVLYEQMNRAFWQAGYNNVRIALVEAKPDIEDTILALTNTNSSKKVKLYPFMVVAGDHAQHDMAGEENSFATTLEGAGYQVESIVKGLGEYPEFRNLYLQKLATLLDEERTE